MNDNGKVSRRDWFRLRTTQSDKQPNSMDGGQAIGKGSSGLKPIADPVNHDGMDLSELPPVREAELSLEQVEQLFADIDAMASNILLMQRSSRSQRADASRATSRAQLVCAKDSLISGTIARIQLRYEWQDISWIDTLENRGDAVRLVRIAHSKRQPS